MVKYIIRMN